MKSAPVQSVMLWIPRVLAVVLALFLGMFAMDAFVAENSFFETSRDFVLHLLPAFCVVAILVLGWRRDGLAALGFFVLGVANFVAISGWKHLPGSLIFSFPPLGVSLSFYARMRLRRRAGGPPD